jgi:hypothetical protein
MLGYVVASFVLMIVTSVYSYKRIIILNLSIYLVALMLSMLIKTKHSLEVYSFIMSACGFLYITLNFIEAIESFEKWVSALKTIDRPAFNINRILSVAVEKIATKDFSDSCVLWRKFEFYLCKLKEAYCDLRLLGLKLLNESEYSKWVKNMEEFDNSILPLIVSNAEFCLEELKIIGRYNAKELSQITKTVLKGVPNDFTNDEADNYERDYLVALKDFKQEFHKEKNVWDSFLDILADRSHQSPSENVMMGRWVDGEKGDLK